MPKSRPWTVTFRFRKCLIWASVQREGLPSLDAGFRHPWNDGDLITSRPSCDCPAWTVCLTKREKVASNRPPISTETPQNLSYYPSPNLGIFARLSAEVGPHKARPIGRVERQTSIPLCPNPPPACECPPRAFAGLSLGFRPWPSPSPAPPQRPRCRPCTRERDQPIPPVPPEAFLVGLVPTAILILSVGGTGYSVISAGMPRSSVQGWQSREQAPSLNQSLCNWHVTVHGLDSGIHAGMTRLIAKMRIAVVPTSWLLSQEQSDAEMTYPPAMRVSRRFAFLCWICGSIPQPIARDQVRIQANRPDLAAALRTSLKQHPPDKAKLLIPFMAFPPKTEFPCIPKPDKEKPLIPQQRF